jgi:hypothetical protein
MSRMPPQVIVAAADGALAAFGLIHDLLVDDAA